MFKPKQQQPNQPNRQRLPMVERPPRQEDIAALFTGAMRIKGCSFELPVKPTGSTKVYLVTCQFDNTSNETVWAMYEGEHGSTQLWTCPHNDLDLVFDMICMSCGTNSRTSLPPEVSQPAAPPPAPYPAAPAYPPPVSPPYQPPQQPQHYPGAAAQPAAPYTPQYAQPQPSPQSYPPQPQQPQQPQPPQPYSPPYQPYSQQSNTYPSQPAYTQPASTPQSPSYSAPAPAPAQPLPYTPAQPPPPAYPPPVTPSPEWQSAFYQPGAAAWPQQPAQPQAQPQAQNAFTSQLGGTAASPAQPPPFNHGQANSYSSSSAALPPDISTFVDLISKSNVNLLLGHLFVEAGIIPERCLDAALKCQELVRQGKLTNEQAILALKRAAELGGILDDDIIRWAKDPEGMRSVSKAAYQSAAPATPRQTSDNSAAQKVVELLKQAGIITEADVETSRKVRNKHGGELTQILVSAGKVGAGTLEAASKCQELVTNGRLRIDKAIMALHYCERMRASLQDALDELNIELM